MSSIAACILAACTPSADASRLATTSAAATAAGSTSFPSGGAFFPFECRDGTTFDPVGDSLTGNSERDIVGDAEYPSFYRAADATHLFFRMRMDLDPRHSSGSYLQPSSWDVLFDTDDDARTYEYMLTADGNLGGTRVRWVRNSSPDPADPRDPANEIPSQDLLRDFTPASDYYSVVPTGDGSAFNGDTDFFITIAIPIADLAAVGVDLTKPLLVWGGTSAQSYALNGDVVCSDGFPGSLPEVDPEPGSLDPTIPDAAADVGTTAEDTALTMSVLSNDWGLTNAPVVVAIATPPAHGTAVVNADGSVTYAPEPDWNGADSYVYTVTDVDGQSSNAPVRVTVTPLDDGPPEARDDIATTMEDESLTTAVLANDTVIDRPGTVTIVTAPLNGNATVGANGTITYVPRANWNGADVCSYTVTDGDGQSATALLMITVTPIDDGPPVAAPDADTAPENTPVTSVVLANDVAPDGPLTVAVTSMPSNGTAVANADGTITFVPRADWHGADSYEYTVSDMDGQSSAALVSITVMDEGPPAARADAASTPEDTELTVEVLANDVVLDGPAHVSIVAPPANGAVLVNGDGSVTYRPAANWSGMDVFGYRVTDADGQASTAEVTIVVEQGNDAPVAIDDVAATDGGAPAVIDVAANDLDVDGDALTVDSFSQGAHGAVARTSNGMLTYAARDGFIGTDSFTYTVSDGRGGASSATVIVTVATPFTGPDASDGPAAGDEPESGGSSQAFGVEGGGCASTGGAESLLVLVGSLAAVSCRRSSRARIPVLR
jgi:hypothetical protein